MIGGEILKTAGTCDRCGTWTIHYLVGAKYTADGIPLEIVCMPCWNKQQAATPEKDHAVAAAA